jgi:hypothetical protein
MVGRPIPRRRQPGIEVTKNPARVTPPKYVSPANSPSNAFDFLGDAMGNVLGTVGRGVKGAWDFTTDELLGVDDFVRAYEADNWGDRGKSLATGAAELGLTFAGGPIIKGVSKVASPVVKAAVPKALPVLDSAGNVIKYASEGATHAASKFNEFQQTVARKFAPAIISTVLATGANAAPVKAAVQTFDAVKAPITRVLSETGEAISKGPSGAVDFIKGAVDDVADNVVGFADDAVDVGKKAADTVVNAGKETVDAVKDKADDAVDFVKNLFGPGVNSADEYLNPQIQQQRLQQQQQQQQQQAGTGTGSGSTSRPNGDNGRKPRRLNIPSASLNAQGVDVNIPYTY